MSSRYLVARALGKDRYNQVIKEDEDLLREFGLTLLFVDAGVTAAVTDEVQGDRIHPWNRMEINGKTWKWLRPLLEELRMSRMAEQPQRLAAK